MHIRKLFGNSNDLVSKSLLLVMSCFCLPFILMHSGAVAQETPSFPEPLGNESLPMPAPMGATQESPRVVPDVADEEARRAPAMTAREERLLKSKIGRAHV